MTHPITRNNTLYFESVNAYPHDHRGVKWASRESQFIRFKILCEIAADIYSSRVLDVGCGLGHLVDYLISQSFSGVYKGIDLVDLMIKGAKKRHPTYDFATNDIDAILLKSADYVLASGLFAFADWETMQATVQALYRRANKGLAFNCLSAPNSLDNKDTLFCPDPVQVLEFCQKLAPRVTLRQDYLANDFTVYLYR